MQELSEKAGAKLPGAGPFRAQVFAVATAAKDSRGYCYNNVPEFGPGLRLAVPRLSSVQFHVEFLRGWWSICHLFSLFNSAW